MTLLYIRHPLGIGDSMYSEEWKRQRSTTVQILRKLGFGKHAVQLKMQEETRYIIEKIMSQCGKPFDPFLTVTLAAMNVLCGLIFSERYDTSDPEFNNLHKNIQGLMRLFFEEAIGDFVWAYSFKSSYKKIMEELKAGCKVVNDFRQKKLQERMQRIKQDGFSEEPGDLVEAYLKELQLNRTMQQNWLPGIINGLFLAGAETVSVACTWTLLHLAERQDVQAKVRLVHLALHDTWQNNSTLNKEFLLNHDMTFCDKIWWTVGEQYDQPTSIWILGYHLEEKFKGLKTWHMSNFISKEYGNTLAALGTPCNANQAVSGTAFGFQCTMKLHTLKHMNPFGSKIGMVLDGWANTISGGYWLLPI